MERPLAPQARRAIIQHKRQDYQAADSRTRRVLLDEITALTGYHRSYARGCSTTLKRLTQRKALTPASVWTRGPPPVVSGVARGQSHLSQAADAISAHLVRGAGAA